MRVLALDTTDRVGSVALVEDGRVVEERAGDPSRSHAGRLPGELVALAGAHGVALMSIDVFAVAAGPGSFTGLRIGMATIQGLAFVTGRRVVGISSLEAVAQLASRELPAGAWIASWIDAQRGEVFSALYQVTANPLFDPERLLEIVPPAAEDPVSTLDRWSMHETGEATFSGDGALRHAELLRAGDSRRRIVPAGLTAGAVGRMATVRASRGEAVEPAALRPVYGRRPDVELERDKHKEAPRDGMDD